MTSDLSQDMLIEGPSRLETALHDQTTSVSLAHGVVYSRRVTCIETCEYGLRRWPIVRLAHDSRFPLARSAKLRCGTPKGVTEEGEGCDNEPDDAGSNPVLYVLGCKA